MAETETETAFNPNRHLCPDGACVGLIGDDGRCSVCARPEGASADSEDGEDGATAAEAPSAVSGFDPGRRLCDDGSCVGVIGADGRCGTCGRKAD